MTATKFLMGVALLLLGPGNTLAQLPSLFEQLPPEQTGIRCINALPEGRYRNIIVYQYYYNGGGVGLGDLNGDGLPEVVITQNMRPNKLYLNQGNFQFQDISEASGFLPVGRASWNTGVALADVNQDGKLDIYISRSGKLQPQNRRNLLYINQGNDTRGIPQFEEQAAAFGLDDAGYGIQTVFLDYDRDGDLDAFIMNHGTNLASFEEVDPAAIQQTRDLERGDKLMQNQNGTFVDVTESVGIESTAIGYGLGAAVEDFNRDGWPDLYVSNDFMEHDYLYINQQDGTFDEIIHEAVPHISNYSMGNDAADINNDGWADLMVLDMVAEDNRRLKANMSGMNPEDFYALVDNGFHRQYMFNTLQLNRGNHRFSDIAQLAGVSNTDWSWAPLLADFDNDGWKDLVVTNGLRKDVRNTDFRNAFGDMLRQAALEGRKDLTPAEWKRGLEMMPSERIPNYAFRNRGDLTFEDVSEAWGLATPGFSNGAAYGDLDGDGDLDLVVSNVDDVPFVYRNRAVEQQTGNYLRLKLKGPANNRQGLGSRVRVRTAEGWQYHRQYAIRGYQSSMEPVMHIGLGASTELEELLVEWPDGRTQRLQGVRANQELQLTWGDARVTSPPEAEFPPLLTPRPAAAMGLDYTHRENEFDDFEREVLLPHKMSNFGPGLATGDVNADGLKDCFVGGASGQTGRLFLQQPNGTFVPAAVQAWEEDREREDMGAALFDSDQDGDLDLYVVSGGNEFSPESNLLQDRLYLNDGEGNFSRYEGLLPDMPASGSCVRPFDFDRDGDLDLFVGGRLTPGQYPLPGRSYLLENDGGIFLDATAARAPGLAELGMVTDALWSDYDGDGWTDLMLVGEWMPVTVFRNKAGSLEQADLPALSSSQGWWFSITAADMDADGDDDYILGNLGLNYKYKASEAEPFEVYSDDLDGNGQRDIVLGYYNEGELYPLRGRSCSSQQIPTIKKQFPSYNAFATATLKEVYGGMGLSQALHYQARTFASSYLENLGKGRLELRALPNEAQLSSTNAIIPHDVNGDGKLDLIIAGNLFAAEVETVRNDASVGLVLLGDGKGHFTPQPPYASGFYVPGDVKDMCLIQVNGQAHVLVANNNGPLEVIRLNR